MTEDLTPIFNKWEYNPDNLVRIIKANDGREVIQLRMPMGIEQYEIDGRPDGKKPHVQKTLLDYYKQKAEINDNFVITYEDFIAIQNEGILYYNRYILLYQLAEYEKTITDTDHNLELFDFIDRYGKNLEEKKMVLQFKPYVLRINALSKSVLALRKKQNQEARKIIEAAINSITSMNETDTIVFGIEKKRSLDHLNNVLNQLSTEKPDELLLLQNELQEAVEIENYEKAAELRDRIKNLESKKK